MDHISILYMCARHVLVGLRKMRSSLSSFSFSFPSSSSPSPSTPASSTNGQTIQGSHAGAAEGGGISSQRLIGASTPGMAAAPPLSKVHVLLYHDGSSTPSLVLGVYTNLQDADDECWRRAADDAVVPNKPPTAKDGGPSSSPSTWESCWVETHTIIGPSSGH